MPGIPKVLGFHCMNHTLKKYWLFNIFLAPLGLSCLFYLAVFGVWYSNEYIIPQYFTGNNFHCKIEYMAIIQSRAVALLFDHCSAQTVLYAWRHLWRWRIDSEWYKQLAQPISSTLNQFLLWKTADLNDSCNVLALQDWGNHTTK